MPYTASIAAAHPQVAVQDRGQVAVEDRVRTRVVLVDDHRSFADLFASVLDREDDFTCVGIGESAAEAMTLARRHRPDLMVMDIRLGGDDGLDTARRIRDIVPEVVIVIVSAASEAEWVSRAAKAGASAFAPKTAPLEEMLSVLRQATLGSMMVSLSTFRDAPKNERRLPLEVAPLSDREQAVLQLVGQALRADEIAPMLNITVNTCRSHIKSILAKLGVKSQLEAVVKAHRLGLIRINAAEMSELAV